MTRIRERKRLVHQERVHRNDGEGVLPREEPSVRDEGSSLSPSQVYSPSAEGWTLRAQSPLVGRTDASTQWQGGHTRVVLLRCFDD